jgi:hypothetical protein
VKFIYSLLIVLFLSVGGAQVASAQQDITPPVLLDVQFDPATIDTSKGPVTITVTIHVTDDLSGVDHVALFFRKPDTTQTAQVEFRADEGWSDIIRGDELDGYHVATMTLPQYAAYGEWELYSLLTRDHVGNRLDLWKPEPGKESKEDDNWPSLYNGFAFAVGEVASPQSQRLFIPSIPN